MNNKNTTIVTICPMCGKSQEVEVDFDGYMKWKFGSCHIQEALPDLSSNDREALISGTCSTCWSMLFGDEHE